MKKMMTRRSFAKVTAMLAGGAALGLAGCMNGDPNKGNGGNGNSGNGGSGNNSGGNNGNNGNTPAPDPEPAKPKLPELTAFNNVFFTQDGTCYVGMPSTFPFYEVEAVEPASYGWLDIPDTTPVKFADYFAVYDGKLYFTEFFHPSDAAARKTPLYMANPDGSNIRVVLDDVACECRPWIVNGVLYYESFDYDEGERIYTHEGTNGGTIQSADAMNCTTVLRSYNMTTGATASVDITRTMAGSFIGATAERVYTLVSAWDDNSTCMSYALDFSDPQPFSTTGYPLGMDAKGHIITRGWSGTTSIWRVCDSDGTVLETFSVTDYGSAFSANRYLIFEDKSKATVVYDTVEMKQIKRVTRLDDWSSTRTYYYYNPYTDTVYYIGKHGTVPGIYTGWGSDGDYSVFLIEGSGQVRRVLPYLDVVWRRTGEWDSAWGYVLQWCEIDFYSYEQLSQLSNEQLFHARNEDFYCHGFDFDKEMKDPELAAYYAKKAWPRELSNKKFSAAELWNFAIIEQIEHERKSPYEGRGYTLEYLENLV